MIETVFNDISSALSKVFEWLSNLNTHLHFVDVAIGVFLVYSVIRFFILPLLKGGVGKSDTVRKKKEVEKDE